MKQPKSISDGMGREQTSMKYAPCQGRPAMIKREEETEYTRILRFLPASVCVSLTLPSATHHLLHLSCI
jgi:hypothetical protein